MMNEGIECWTGNAALEPVATKRIQYDSFQNISGIDTIFGAQSGSSTISTGIENKKDTTRLH